MGTKFNNTKIVEKMHATYAQKKKRVVAVEADTWEKTLDQIEFPTAKINVTTLEKIADYFGFDVEINFVERNGNENEN